MIGEGLCAAARRRSTLNDKQGRISTVKKKGYIGQLQQWHGRDTVETDSSVGVA